MGSNPTLSAIFDGSSQKYDVSFSVGDVEDTGGTHGIGVFACVAGVSVQGNDANGVVGRIYLVGIG